MRHVVRLLASVVLAVTLVVGAAGVLVSPTQAQIWPAPTSDPDRDPQLRLNEFENRILVQVNRARRDAGLKTVKVFESCVDRQSERWARTIKRSGDLVHRDQAKVIRRCDLMWTGETLVRGVGLTPAAAVNAWLNSPAHYDVIMKKRARWAGIGVRIDQEGRYVGVLNFGDAT